jgi:hypothetical protein
LRDWKKQIKPSATNNGMTDVPQATRPRATDLDDNDELLEDIERGQGLYVVLCENEGPSQIFFAGYSCD